MQWPSLQIYKAESNDHQGTGNQNHTPHSGEKGWPQKSKITTMAEDTEEVQLPLSSQHCHVTWAASKSDKAEP